MSMKELGEWREASCNFADELRRRLADVKNRSVEMHQMTKGQRWIDREGAAYDVVDVGAGMAKVREMMRPNTPTITVDAVTFARTHKLVADADGNEVKPPAPPPLQPGDVVRLRCGGPPMVVSSIDEKGPAFRGFLPSEKQPLPFVGDPPMAVLVWHADNGAILLACVATALLVRCDVPTEPRIYDAADLVDTIKHMNEDELVDYIHRRDKGE